MRVSRARSLPHLQVRLKKYPLHISHSRHLIRMPSGSLNGGFFPDVTVVAAINLYCFHPLLKFMLEISVVVQGDIRSEIAREIASAGCGWHL